MCVCVFVCISGGRWREHLSLAPLQENGSIGLINLIPKVIKSQIPAGALKMVATYIAPKSIDGHIGRPLPTGVGALRLQTSEVRVF